MSNWNARASDGSGFKGGKFSQSESDFIMNFIESSRIDLEKLSPCHREAISKEERHRYKTMYLELSSLLPHRTRRSICKRAQHLIDIKLRKTTSGGEAYWTEESEQTLLSLVELHGTNWSIISRILQRKLENCQTKYSDMMDRIYVGTGNKLTKTLFSSEEDESLLRAVMKVTKTSEDATELPLRSAVSWVEVARKLKNRTYRTYSKHWSLLRRYMVYAASSSSISLTEPENDNSFHQTGIQFTPYVKKIILKIAPPKKAVDLIKGVGEDHGIHIPSTNVARISRFVVQDFTSALLALLKQGGVSDETGIIWHCLDHELLLAIGTSLPRWRRCKLALPVDIARSKDLQVKVEFLLDNPHIIEDFEGKYKIRKPAVADTGITVERVDTEGTKKRKRSKGLNGSVVQESAAVEIPAVAIDEEEAVEVQQIFNVEKADNDDDDWHVLGESAMDSDNESDRKRRKRERKEKKRLKKERKEKRKHRDKDKDKNKHKHEDDSEMVGDGDNNDCVDIDVGGQVEAVTVADDVCDEERRRAKKEKKKSKKRDRERRDNAEL